MLLTADDLARIAEPHVGEQVRCDSWPYRGELNISSQAGWQTWPGQAGVPVS